MISSNRDPRAERRHPDSYMKDDQLIHKLLIPQGNLTYEQIAMQNLSTEERKLINDFVYLMEKSKQLFQQLRHLPQHGQFNWQIHFSRTFDCFSKLWKFQQDHRGILDLKYGLQRWQIGEIASKIGQLYYHYYLRTSDTSYLQEALVFYLAMRQRNYYNKYDDDTILLKKLRYYTRFLVVAFMVNKMDLVLELKTEMSVLIEELAETRSAVEVNEWKAIVSEVTNFRGSLNHISVTRMDTSTVFLSHRLLPENRVLPELTLSPNPLKLHSAIIAGTKIGQPKLTELSIDMFRMGTILERNPKALSSVSNPVKQYLYKPSSAELLCCLSEQACNLPRQSAQLIYLSGNNVSYTDRSTSGQDTYTSGGGIHFGHRDAADNKYTSRYSPELLHAEDVHPFLRHATLLIVEGEGRSFFSTVSPVFREPVVVLLSPKLIPHTLRGNKLGSLMTLFLHCPMMAFCMLCNIEHISDTQWKKGLQIIGGLLAELLTLLSHSKSVHPHYIQLVDDPFIRLIVLRFCLFSAVLQMHTAFKTEEYYPSCVPSLSAADIFLKPSIKRGIVDIANTLECLVLFSDP